MKHLFLVVWLVPPIIAFATLGVSLLFSYVGLKAKSVIAAAIIQHLNQSSRSLLPTLDYPETRKRIMLCVVSEERNC